MFERLSVLLDSMTTIHATTLPLLPPCFHLHLKKTVIKFYSVVVLFFFSFLFFFCKKKKSWGLRNVKSSKCLKSSLVYIHERSLSVSCYFPACTLLHTSSYSHLLILFWSTLKECVSDTCIHTNTGNLSSLNSGCRFWFTTHIFALCDGGWSFYCILTWTTFALYFYPVNDTCNSVTLYR